MLKKTPIILLCVAAISFFLYKVIANTSKIKPEISSSKNRIEDPGVPVDSTNKNPSLSNRVLKVGPIQKPTYYDRLETMMQKTLNNDINVFNRLSNNPNLKNLFKSQTSISGFYGKDKYKIDYHISSTKVNPSQPSRILISGLTKYKKNIRSIHGYFEMDAAAINSKDKGDDQLNTNYCVKGHFHFDETFGEKNVGTYDGTWIADISEIDNDIHSLEFTIPENSFAFENLLLLSGNWQNANKDMTKQLCFSQNISAVGADIFKAFSYGDRDVSINEAFASKGWNEYYENEEWWNQSSKQ